MFDAPPLPPHHNIPLRRAIRVKIHNTTPKKTRTNSTNTALITLCSIAKCEA